MRSRHKADGFLVLMAFSAQARQHRIGRGDRATTRERQCQKLTQAHIIREMFYTFGNNVVCK